MHNLWQLCTHTFVKKPKYTSSNLSIAKKNKQQCVLSSRVLNLYNKWYVMGAGIAQPVQWQIGCQDPIPSGGNRFFSTPLQSPYGFRASYPTGTVGAPLPRLKWPGHEKFTAQLHLVLTSRMAKLYFQSPVCLHGIMLK